MSEKTDRTLSLMGYYLKEDREIGDFTKQYVKDQIDNDRNIKQLQNEIANLKKQIADQKKYIKKQATKDALWEYRKQSGYYNY